jgi:hypothetical protein
MPVTPDTFIRAESDRYFYATSQLAGGVNRFNFGRKMLSLDEQTVVRMNRDTLYGGAVIDTAQGATITFPSIPDGRYASVLILDNDHYAPLVIYEPGTHELPRRTRYVLAAVRIHVKDPNDPKEIAAVNALQDRFRIDAASAVPFPRPEWDVASLDALRRRYEAEFVRFDTYPDDWQGPPRTRRREDPTPRGCGGMGAVPEPGCALHQLEPVVAGRRLLQGDLCRAREPRILVDHGLRQRRLHQERALGARGLQHEARRRWHVHRVIRRQRRVRQRPEPGRHHRRLESADADLPPRALGAERRLQASCPGARQMTQSTRRSLLRRARGWTLVLFAASVGACATPPPASSDAASAASPAWGGLSPADARSIAAQAYVYLYPMVQSYQTIYRFSLDPSGPEFKGPMNTVANVARVFTHRDTTIVTANSDTPYSDVMMDLRAEPLVVTMPRIERDRYDSLQLVDLYTHNVDHHAAPPAPFAGPGPGEQLAAGAQRTDGDGDAAVLAAARGLGWEMEAACGGRDATPPKAPLESDGPHRSRGPG